MQWVHLLTYNFLACGNNTGSDGSMDAQLRSLPHTLGASKYDSLDEQRTHLNFERFTSPLVGTESWKYWWEWYGRERGTPHLPMADYNSFTVAMVVKSGTLGNTP